MANSVDRPFAALLQTSTHTETRFWYGWPVKRTFQVALFGASDPANQRVLASLQRARGGELVAIPDGAMGTVAHFFDYEIAADKLRARFRIRAVTGDDFQGQAFLGLMRADAVVFVPSGKQDIAAWREAQNHFATYGAALVLVAAERAVRGVKGVAVPTNGATLADAIEREVIAAFRAGQLKGRSTTTPSSAYVTRAKALADAAAIAIAIGPRAMKRFHESTYAMALHPELGFATTSSLASLETGFFTYWNEAHGVGVQKFWREVARRGLSFRQRNVIDEVLARGRISNRGDYDTVTDLLSDEQLTVAQRKRLDAMLGAYESRSR